MATGLNGEVVKSSPKKIEIKNFET